MLKPSKGVVRRLQNYISTLDRFPVTFQFRVGNKVKYGTFLGGIWYILFVIFSAFFMLIKSRDFFFWSNYKLTFIEKAIYPTTKMFFNKMEFNFALQVTFENNTSIVGTKYEDLFITETYVRQKQNNSKSETILSERPCTEHDFKDSSEDPLFKKFLFNELTCLESNSDLFLRGTHHDEEMTYIVNKVTLNPQYSKDERKIKEIFRNNLFKFRIYFIDTLNDVSSLQNPIFQKIDSLYSYLDLNFMKKIKIGFQEFQYKEDKNLFVHKFNQTSYFKKVSVQESQVTIQDRLISKLPEKLDLISIYLNAHNNVKIVQKTFENLPEFLGAVSANLSNLLIWSSILMNIYNQMQAKQYVMSKIMKYNDNTSKEKAANSIRYFTNTFNKNVMSEFQQNFSNLLKKNKKVTLESKLSSDNPGLSSLQNLLIPAKQSESVIIEEQSKEKSENIHSGFDPKNFLKQDSKGKPTVKSIGANFEMALKKSDDIIIIEDAKANQKEKLNESNQEEVENAEELIAKQNANSMGFFDILIYVLCCGNCKEVREKGLVFEHADKIFNKNLDIINYMKKMEEISIFKYLILDNETLDLVNFLSKPSVSIGQKVNQDPEYLKFFYPKEKINSINLADIDKLKNSYDEIIKRENPTKVDKRVLRLFKIQLQDMMASK